MARSASCCTPWSCMKRLTFMANIWAGDIRPYGSVWAAGPETVLHARALPEAAELALGQRAEHDDALGLAGGDGGGRVGDGARAAAAAAAPLHGGEAELVAAERGRQARRLVAVVAVRREAVDVARVDPGVGACLQHRVEASLNSGSGDWPHL